MIFPLFIIKTRVHIASTSCMMCVESITVFSFPSFAVNKPVTFSKTNILGLNIPEMTQDKKHEIDNLLDCLFLIYGLYLFYKK